MIEQVNIDKKFIDYLVKRRILAQYLKKEESILKGDFKQADFKLRQPKKDGIYYFRINKQYRGFGVIEGKILKIIDISNHS